MPYYCIPKLITLRLGMRCYCRRVTLEGEVKVSPARLHHVLVLVLTFRITMSHCRKARLGRLGLIENKHETRGVISWSRSSTIGAPQ